MDTFNAHNAVVNQIEAGCHNHQQHRERGSKSPVQGVIDLALNDLGNHGILETNRSNQGVFGPDQTVFNILGDHITAEITTLGEPCIEPVEGIEQKIKRLFISSLAAGKTADGNNWTEEVVQIVERVRSQIDGGTEVAECPLPVLFTVVGSANTPRPAGARRLMQYKKAVTRLQGRLNALRREARDRGVSMVLVFEGWDAAGKGGTIKRSLGGEKK